MAIFTAPAYAILISMSLNNEDLEDIKQIVTAATANLATKIDTLGIRLDKRIDILDEKTDVILKAVGDRIENHEARPTKLEAHAA